MRVTELTKHNAVNKNLNTNSEELQDLMIGMSNGKILNKPSDDPIGAAKVQDFRTSINHSKTLEKNISADKVWLNSNEETVKQIVETLMHVKDLALDGANGSSNAENRSTLAHEIKLITNDLIKLGNKKEGKLYVFSGTKTFTKPLSLNDEVVKPKVKFYGTRIKSSEKVIPIDQKKPLTGIAPGTFTIYLDETPEYLAETRINEMNQLEEVPIETPATADTGETEQAAAQPELELIPEDLAKKEVGEKKIQVVLNGDESIREIVKKINEAAIEEGEYIEDPHSPIGYKTKLAAEVGVDNSIYIDPTKGINIRFGEDSAGFFQRMKFQTIGNPDVTLTGAVVAAPTTGAETTTEGEAAAAAAPESDVAQAATLPENNETIAETETTGATGADATAETTTVKSPLLTAEIEMDPVEFGAEFIGFSKDKYLVRVIKGGTFGLAHIIISDDGGKTWSQPKVLNQENEVFNPEGKASNKVNLEFKAKGKPFFKEGLEFQYNGNEFVTYNGNDQIKEVLVDNGIKVALNINAKQLFKEESGNKDTVDIFDMMNRLSEALEDDDQLAVMKSIEDVDKSINQVLKIRSQIGSIFKELEASEERIQQNMDFKRDELSKIEDMDLAKGAVDLNKAELKHKTALDASARLIQPTLIDFLR
jgi:flagellin-like hook-associated protein FlgL